MKSFFAQYITVLIISFCTVSVGEEDILSLTALDYIHFHTLHSTNLAQMMAMLLLLLLLLLIGDRHV